MAKDDLETTASLVQRAQSGDLRAREALAARLRPRLLRLAHGRLPLRARGLQGTEDIVQEALARAFLHLNRFESRGEGAFLAWLWRILMNQLSNADRSASSRPLGEPLPLDLRDGSQSPLEALIGRETLETFDAALEQLSEDHRNAIVFRFVFGYDYADLARVLERRTPNAARMVVVRGLMNLTDLLKMKGVSTGGE